MVLIGGGASCVVDGARQSWKLMLLLDGVWVGVLRWWRVCGMMVLVEYVSVVCVVV